MAAATDQQRAQLEQLLTEHPEILSAFQEYRRWQQTRGRMQYVDKSGPPTPKQVLAQYGINFPGLEDYQIHVDPQGAVQLQRVNWLQRNLDWIVPVSVIGGGAAISAATSGGAAGGAAATPPVYTSPAAANAGLSGGLVAPASGGAAGAATAAGGGSLLHALLPTIIGGAATVGGAAIAAHGQSEAAKKQAEQDDKALALQKEMFDLQRADLAPYRGLGAGAIGNLAYLSGITMPSDEAKPASSMAPYIVPGAVDAHGRPYPGRATTQDVPNATLAQQGRTSGPITIPNLGTIGQHAALGGPTVKVEYQGEVRDIPAHLLPRALQQGGRQVQ